MPTPTIKTTGKRNAYRLGACALATVALMGCSTQAAKVQVQADAQKADTTSQARLDAMVSSVVTPNPDYYVNRPYIVGKTVELDREVTLPKAFQQGIKTEVSFKGASSVDLLHAAQKISLAIGVPVRVRPDALMPQSSFTPRSGGQTSVPQAGPDGAIAAQPVPTSPVDSSPIGGVMVNLQVGDMPAADLLDYLTGQIGAYWKYENGSVEIYRLVTRTFEVHAQAGKTSVTAGLGRSGQQGASFDSQTQTKIEQSNMDPIAEVRTAVEAMLTRGGNIVVGNGTLVVTDTKESVDKVATYIEQANKALTRRVKLYFESIEVTARDQNEVGMNWDLVFSRMGQLTNGGLIQTTLGSRGPTPNTSAQAGQLSAVITGSSQLSGSQVLIRALSDVGTIVNHTRVPLVTINRSPVQYAVRTNFDYVSDVQVSTVASSAGTTTSPAITQKEETVGVVLTVTPNAFADGRILMRVAFDSTTLRSLEPYSVGQAGSTSTVQQRTIDGSGALQSISMRSGQSMLISGFEKNSSSFDERRLDKKLPLIFNGSDKNNRTRNTTVLLITAVAEDGV